MNILVCDDVRREVTNKYILVGVYAADIIVPAFPAWIGLAVWMEVVPKAIGEHEVHFRFGMSNRPAFNEVKAQVNVRELGKGAVGLALPTAQHLVEEETDFVVEWKQAGQWQLLKRKKVTKAPSTSLLAGQPAPSSSLPSDR